MEASLTRLALTKVGTCRGMISCDSLENTLFKFAHKSVRQCDDSTRADFLVSPSFPGTRTFEQPDISSTLLSIVCNGPRKMSSQYLGSYEVLNSK